LTSSLSLTSALSASVVLASRLPSTSHVFSLVLLSVGLFAGWPVLAKGVRASAPSQEKESADNIGSRQDFLLTPNGIDGHSGDLALSSITQYIGLHAIWPDIDFRLVAGFGKPSRARNALVQLDVEEAARRGLGGSQSPSEEIKDGLEIRMDQRRDSLARG
jgi:hypothetical protein